MWFFSVRMKNVQTYANHQPCKWPSNHKAILIPTASFMQQHFDPHSKKETTRKQKAKFLTDKQNMENVLKQRHFSLK